MAQATRQHFESIAAAPPHGSVLYALNPNYQPSQVPVDHRGYSVISHQQTPSYSQIPWQTVPETYYVPQGLAAETRYYNELDERVDRNRMTMAEEEYGGRETLEARLATALIEQSSKNRPVFTPNPYAVNTRVSTAGNNSKIGSNVLPPPAKVAAAVPPPPVYTGTAVSSVGAVNTRPVTAVTPAEDYTKMQAVGAVGAAGGEGLKARRYNDEGEFLCGKWGWIAAALLFLALLTLSLLYGLGILGGEAKDSTKVGATVLPNFSSTSLSEGSNSEGKDKVKEKLNGKPSTQNGKPSTQSNRTGAGSGAIKGETTISTLPGTDISTKPHLPVISPVVSPSTTNEGKSKPQTNTAEPLPISPVVITQPETNGNSAKPLTNTAKPSEKTSLTPPPQTTPTSTPIAPTTPLNPNSIPASPVGTPSRPAAPTSTPTMRPPVIEPPALPPAPVYSGPALFDIYPNYVMAQPVQQ